ncbi:hypothetical protein [Methylobacterium sp. WL19]|uniref:hypothetical protein n=1 Tax=Methylobacterium sp. WL19 TaxID=2603896 RepID=UPI0011CC7A5F|nr:hypothetical protein [Methylobacterium sp. WL19]TXN33932.1 hypothetical protein FV220_00345 [Methylobacterium sp. WL19]
MSDKRQKTPRAATSYRAPRRIEAIKKAKQARRLIRHAAIARRAPAGTSPAWQRVSPPRYPQKAA